MGRIIALAAVVGIYTTMLRQTARHVKQVVRALYSREPELAPHEQELLKKMHQSARPSEF